MFGKFRQKESSNLDDPIERVLEAMVGEDHTSDEYAQLLSHLERLTKLKTKTRPERVSRDTMAVVGGQIISVLIVVGYEHLHVMTSKALTFLKSK